MDQNTLESHKLAEIASRHGVSLEAALAIFEGMRRSGGSMAQFSHPDLGGMGQWSSGMLMIGELSNSALKEKVNALCDELSSFVRLHNPADPNTQNNSMEQAESMDPIKPMKPMKAMEPFKPMEPIKPFVNIQWWPKSLGTPSSVGSQNQNRYAYFPETNRLAIEHNSKVTIFDTGKHKIHGASQSQSDTSSLTFESQLGRVTLSELTEVAAPQD